MTHIFSAHIIDNGNTCLGSQKWPIANLNSQRFPRSVQHSLSMETDHINFFRLQRKFVQKVLNDNGMKQCLVMLELL